MTISSPTTGKPSANDLVLTINMIRGIYASCVILDRNENVSEIHIVASNSRKPKPIVRDIETMLFVKHQIKIDYRAISMVQIADEHLLGIPIARPEIREVVEEVIGDRKRIRVSIHGGGRKSSGEAYEKIENPDLFRTTAQATINALERLLSNRIDVRLEDVQTFRLGPREILIVLATTLIDNREETFVGSSFVGSRPMDSAARATLDALNRRIHNLLLQAPRQEEEEEKN